MECIVIGAGASGLFAARKLASSNHHVKIIEARDRIGGRICTNQPQGFSHSIEGGAEFLHGDVELTQALCKEANVTFAPLSGNMYRIEKGELCKDDFFENEWKILLDELESLTHDRPLSEVLEQKFPSSDYDDFKNNIRRFVEGYSAADVEKVSAIALRKEWSGDDDPTQYRPDGGYGRLMNFLQDEIKKYNGEIILNSPVKSIRWEKHKAVVITANGRSHHADKVLVTVPTGVLQQNGVQFSPEPPGLKNAVENIGFGAVVKIVIEFKHAFWNDPQFRSFKNLDFLFTDATIPTWWPFPSKTNVLTGWLGGPVLEKKTLSEEDLFRQSLDSLAYIFACPLHQLADIVSAWKVFQWLHDPHSCGAYTYAKPETEEAIKFLMRGLEQTVYFAGESIYLESHTGTVEAALVSGRDAAERMMSEQ